MLKPTTRSTKSKSLVLSEISIYPIKSLSGISLEHSDVSPIGLLNDRRMMLVDEQNVFISQRRYPLMALVKVQISTHGMSLIAPTMPQLDILSTQFEKESVSVDVWGSQAHGFVASEAVNRWFSQFLQVSVRLVNYDHARPRLTDAEFSQSGDSVSFADGFPLLLISQASLDDLNTKLNHPVSMRSFRPNLVVSGCEPYAEDQWKRIRIDTVEFDIVKTCSRCVLTTVDPDTGIKREDKEPLKTLSTYRRSEHGVIFGMNLIPRTLGNIHINSSVEIIA